MKGRSLVTGSWIFRWQSVGCSSLLHEIHILLSTTVNIGAGESLVMSDLSETNRLHEKLNVQALESLWTSQVFHSYIWGEYLKTNHLQFIGNQWQFHDNGADYCQKSRFSYLVDFILCILLFCAWVVDMHWPTVDVWHLACPLSYLTPSLLFLLPCHVSPSVIYLFFLLTGRSSFPLISLLSSGNPYPYPPSLYPPPSLCISPCSIALYDL